MFSSSHANCCFYTAVEHRRLCLGKCAIIWSDSVFDSQLSWTNFSTTSWLTAQDFSFSHSMLIRCIQVLARGKRNVHYAGVSIAAIQCAQSYFMKTSAGLTRAMMIMKCDYDSFLCNILWNFVTLHMEKVYTILAKVFGHSLWRAHKC